MEEEYPICEMCGKESHQIHLIEQEIMADKERNLDELTTITEERNALNLRLHEISEIYIQRESGLPETAPEAYLLQELKEIYNIAKGVTEPSLIITERDALRALLIECLDIDFIGTGNLEQRIRNALEGGKE